MPRRKRHDAPGVLHHLGNGGLHGDPLFLLHPDYERFTDLLTKAVEAERILVHAAVFMTTHFHLLVVSLDGKISRTLQWITGQHASRLNQDRHLKGYVHGGRFWSTPVDTWGHLLAAIPYIDWNPMAARMVTGPFLHPYGSAIHHIHEGERPPWLCGDLIDELIGPGLRAGLSRQDAYVQAFGLDKRNSSSDALVQARLTHPSRERDDLDWLLSADGRRVTSWLRRKARSKLRASPCLPMADAGSIHRTVAERCALEPDAHLVSPKGRKTPLWPIVEAGLLRDLGGLSYAAMAETMGFSATHVQNRYRLHRKTILEDETYAAVVADVAVAALRACFGAVPREMAAKIFQRRVRRLA